ncbi:MAG: hypothetical protein KBS54_03945, partial [Synergistaceae bacterium]|nr:hypothetical protein [Candidatus Equadaptatus faecalis]
CGRNLRRGRELSCKLQAISHKQKKLCHTVLDTVSSGFEKTLKNERHTHTGHRLDSGVRRNDGQKRF